MTSGDVWIGHIWGADRFAIQEAIPDFAYYIPEEGGVKGSDTVATFTGSPHPIAAQMFINHLLDAHNSAAQHQPHLLHGPERGSEGVHRSGDPRATRRSTPTRRSSTSSRSC